MFGRRVPPHLVFAFSLLLAALCGWAAYAGVTGGKVVWGIIAAVFAVWFAVDAFRSYGWAQAKKRADAEARAQNHPNLK
ncbi:hypothetical protein GCM10008956_26030 [Deinococcus arenae]|uniref:Uncharacterized protein n=1 Tax=Deinococcus arenae TaxID=1452751 RepID=A0A8H9LBY6_9DEIO|nr:hypothetical protein [Deinococcus arenae]AWT34416.1 hypothetical protein DM785_01755 [Deinococcus actinosclerus]GGM48657.1 hypothetical protein GCM10008956_26030 [Deinococcus arenae]